MGLTPDDLRQLLAAFEESSWQEMDVSVAGDTLHVSRRHVVPGPGPASTTARTAGRDPLEMPPAAPPAVAPTPHAAPAAASTGGDPGPPARADAKGVPVLAPSVGLFWRAPSPGASPFVEVGAQVDSEDTIGIVEVMKLMHRVPAGVPGVVTAVLVANGGMVEHGQPLVLVDPSA